MKTNERIIEAVKIQFQIWVTENCASLFEVNMVFLVVNMVYKIVSAFSC